MIYIALSILVTAALSAKKYKGACDLKKECAKRVFEGDQRALCLGYQACFKAEFPTHANSICNGARACEMAKFPEYTDDDAEHKVLCNGYMACTDARGLISPKTGLQAKTKVACNGFKSCQSITGGITSDGDVSCDGDLACASDDTRGYNDNLMIRSTTNVLCNGKKSCAYANIEAVSTVACDGDAACIDGYIKAGSAVGCGGKKSCKNAVITAPTVYGYGMCGAVDAKIKDDDGSYLTVKALGFRALGAAKIISTDMATSIYAYGWKGMLGASIKCKQSSSCIVICKSTACKLSAIFVDSTSTLAITPNGCDPDDANYAVSKRDPSLPAKQKGIHCPSITKAGVSYGITDEELEEMATKWEADIRNNEEVKQMLDEVDEMERKLDALLAEEELIFEEQEAYEKAQELGVAEFMVEGNQLIGATHSQNLIMSNLMTALAVFVITLVIAVVYYAYKAPKTGQFKPLLEN